MDLLNKFVQFVPDEVADRPEIESVLQPMAKIVALDRLGDGAGTLGAQSLRDNKLIKS